MHGIPSTRSFGIAPYGRCCLIDDAHGLADASRDLGADPAVDCQPSVHVAAEMRSRRARDEPDATPYSLTSAESPTNDTQGADRWACKLEHGRRSRIQIRVHVAHLRANVATAAVESTRGFPRSVEPS